MAQRFQKSTCGAPIRDVSAPTRNACWGIFALAAVSVLARFCFRCPQLKGSGYGLDDGAIFVSLLVLAPLNGVADELTRLGLGRDIWCVPVENTTRMLYLFWVEEYLYLWVMTAAKLSVVFLYLRLWTGLGRDWFWMACYAMVGFIAAWTVTVTLALALQCQPINYVSLLLSHCFFFPSLLSLPFPLSPSPHKK